MLIKTPYRKEILRTTAPAMLYLAGYNLIGITDVLMIGRLGNVALASTGIANFVFLLLLSFPLGLGVGVQRLVAKELGLGNQKLTGQHLIAGLVVAAAIGVFISIIAMFFCSELVAFFSADLAVIKAGTSYLMGRLPSLALVAGCACFRGFWVSNGNHMLPLISLLVCFWVNLTGNYCLIFGIAEVPALGVAGAGIASSIAAVAGLVCYVLCTFKQHYCSRFFLHLPTLQQAKHLLNIALPQSMNLFFVTLGILMIFVLVAQLGTQELAVLNVLIMFILLANIWVEGFGSGAITLVAKTIGAKRLNEAYLCGWEITQLGTLGVALMCLGLYFSASSLATLFIIEPELALLAVLPLKFMSVWLCLDAFGKLLSFALIGTGQSKLVLRYTFVFWWLFGLPLQWFFGVYLNFGLAAIFAVPIAVTLCSAVTFSYFWLLFPGKN